MIPRDFLWGVSTSAHQVEGGTWNNQWAQWERDGKIPAPHRAGLACDWWRNAERDFLAAKELGVNALRLSVEWSRIEPDENRWDHYALERYAQMLRHLRELGIRPHVTLHHFTHPIWFERQGGFLSPRSPYLFSRFVRKVVTMLGPLCSDWATFNEPNVYTSLGYQVGYFPPGYRGRLFDGARVTLNMAHAHARAYDVIHSLQPNASVGWAQHIIVLAPTRTESRVDQKLCDLHDRLFNGNFADTVISGSVPFPLFADEEISRIVGKYDYIGINFYSRLHAQFDHRRRETLCAHITVPEHLPQGDHGLQHPYGEAFTDGMFLAAQRFASLGKPLYFLEHGVPDRDDRIRPTVLREANAQIQKILAAGIDLRGYFHWSLIDNFEWNEGWHLRFGLIEL
ncbi:MAG: glycoside hydrolase family 1 protein, partial [Acidobacteriales bacterium]|nr:glycoside hydrolase family 1 protein [Terriglobales bacterium]